MWLERDEVERSIRELGLAERLRALPEDEAVALYKRIEARFSTEPGARWIWEHLDHLRIPDASRRFADDRAFTRLSSIVPGASEELLFFPGSDQDRKCTYRGTITAA
jgi:hypothetical protein